VVKPIEVPATVLDPGTPKARLVEPLAVFLVATALAAGLFWLSRSVAFVREILHGAIAVIFLLAPSYAARLFRRPFDYQSAGLCIEPIGLNLRVLGLALVATWPLFLAGFFLYYGLLCSGQAPIWAHRITEILSPICPSWLGLGGFALRLPAGILLLALSQLLVVALPEEVFFRGYLMSRLEERWPSQRRLWGATVGWPLLISSLLFGLGHFLVDFQPGRLAVMFPALVFGWMRQRTGSLAPAAVFHALCNLFSDVLHESFFG
jgi:membrane protease YdiL (CAAX protease family)